MFKCDPNHVLPDGGDTPISNCSQLATAETEHPRFDWLLPDACRPGAQSDLLVLLNLTKFD